jgi:CMP-N-acetylneuraminic acid synthetase|tara:strand:- start:1049 stop:1732 length:684 start_codon:yes stop_codon:yes gene_type:complete
MEILSIIPARGGSKGIYKKNIRDINGKPLIAYTIANAISSSYINRVVVSTDDCEIEQISKKFGAEVLLRPKEISSDFSKSEEALLHVIKTLYKIEKYKPDIIVFLQCTSPLTIKEDIDNTIDVLLNTDVDTVLSVSEFHYFLWKAKKDGNASGINHDKRTRFLRQERRPQYIETGAVYVMKTDGFLHHKHRFFGKTALNVIDKERFLEIDDEIDLEIAEVMMKKQSR